MFVDDLSTWPSDLVNLLRAAKSLDDPDPALIEEIEAALTDESVVGWHCTRLRDEELRAVISEGLKPSDAALLGRRLDAAQASGDISTERAAALRARNQARALGRDKKIWFVFVRDLLSDGTERLFRSWGGECLYNTHERDPVLGPLLRGIGQPCIVECTVPIAGTRFFFGIGDTLTKAYRRHAGLPSSPPRMEGYTERAVPVDRVLLGTDPEFARLTQYRP